MHDRQDIVKSWNRKQNQRRREIAEHSSDIAVLHSIDIHNDNTVRKAQVLFDKLDKRKRRMVGYKQWDLELEKNIDRLEREIGTLAGVEGRSRRLRANSMRSNERPLSRAPSVVSISSGSNSLPHSHSSSRSITISSPSNEPSSSTKGRQSSVPHVSADEPRPSRPLPRRAAPLAQAKAKPSRFVGNPY